MKPENTDKRKRKGEAVRGVALFFLLQTGCIAGFAALCSIPDLPRWLFYLFAALAVLCVIPMVAALAVLKKRFQEIEGGEFDEARQY